MPVNPFNSVNIIAGAASVLTSPRDTALATVTAEATPAPTAGSFAVSSTDAALLRIGDRLQLTGTARTMLADELSTLPVITNISSDANPVITVSPAFGSAPPTTAGGVTQVWKLAGATDGGVTMSAQKTVTDLDIDQSLTPVDAVDTALAIMLTAPMAEATLENFALAAGIPASTVAGTLSVNGDNLKRSDRFAFVGPAPDGKTRYAVIHKGKASGKVDHTADKKKKPIYNLQTKAYADSTMSPDTLHIVDA